MALAERELRRFTPEEYLTIERDAEYRSEYICGRIYAMSGSSPEHDTISANITAALVVQLKGKPCRAFTSNMRMRTVAEGLYSYPDVSVVCGELRFHDGQRDTITNSKVIVEVLSRSTERWDRGGKFEHYKTIDTFTDYFLVAQDRPRIEHHVRQPDGEWRMIVADGLDGRVRIDSIGCTLELSDVYDRIQFEADAANETTNPE